MKIKQISPQKHEFLKRLDCIALKPKMLYYYGKLPENRPKVVAIVGSRKMTSYGREHAYRAAYELAERGVVVVSGLALGVDAMAHRGALDAGGVTIGVLGTPIDRMYPAANRGLADEIIAKNGAIFSECPPFEAKIATAGQTRPDLVETEVESGPTEAELAAWHKVMDSRVGAKAVFLRRNRLISGVADAVIIIEADERSGSLNTAAHALEQGRSVFAVPGDLSRRMSRGCNALFGKGALAYTSVQDVLDELGIKETKKRVVKGDTPLEQAILASLEAGLNDGEEIISVLIQKGILSSAAEFNQTITLLEIKGLVRRLYGNKWAIR